MAHHYVKNIESVVAEKKRTSPRSLIYFLLFLYTLHITPTVYVLSSFLEQLVGQKYVGYVYTIASILSIILFILIRQILQVKGSYKTFITFASISFVNTIVSSLILIVDINPFWTTIFIISNVIAFTAHAIGFLCFDIFLEHYSKDSKTGEIRGNSLTFGNIAFLMGPFMASFMIGDSGQVGRVFLVSAIVLIPTILLSAYVLRNFRDPNYSRSEFLQTAYRLYHHPDISKILTSNFILNFFYSWMIIYTPIFLHDYIGFSLSQTVALIGLGLIPFLLFQGILGRLADKFWGEKEILATGFIIASGATLIMSLVDLKSFWLWALILFTTRIGASMIEVMSDVYLFKKIDDHNIDTIGFYRMMRSTAYIVASILASILLIFISIKFIFVVLAIILAYGAGLTLGIRDTK